MELDAPDPDEIFTNPANWEPVESRRCDACWMRMEYLVEIPRSRSRLHAEPARLRLCRLHAQNVIHADEYAVVHSMKPTDEESAA